MVLALSIYSQQQGRRQKIFQGRGANGKKTESKQKCRKIALFVSSREPTEKRPKNSKKGRKNSTFKPLFTIFVPCLKIQGGATFPPAPCCRRPWPTGVWIY